MGGLKEMFSGPKIPDPPKPPKPIEDQAQVPGVTPEDMRKKLAATLSSRKTLLSKASPTGNTQLGGTG